MSREYFGVIENELSADLCSYKVCLIEEEHKGLRLLETGFPDT